MDIVQSDEYEEMAMTYQCLEMDRLNEVLRGHGITDKAMRKAICTAYFFDSGQYLDTGWFKSDDGEKTLWPVVAFAERTEDESNEEYDNGLPKIEKLHLAQSFAFHEAAHGDVDWYFEEQAESIGEIVHGNL